MSQFREFRSLLGSFGDLSWSIAVIKAPIDQITKTLSKSLKTKVYENVLISEPKEYEALGDYITIIEIKDSKWVIVFYSLGVWQSFAEKAKVLSKKLKTQVLLYEAEDTSGAETIELFENGSKIKKYLSQEQSEYLDELADEISEYEGFDDDESYLDADNTSKEIVSDYEVVFNQLGITLVAAYPKEDGTVAVAKETSSQIQRVDLISR